MPCPLPGSSRLLCALLVGTLALPGVSPPQYGASAAANVDFNVDHLHAFGAARPRPGAEPERPGQPVEGGGGATKCWASGDVLKTQWMVSARADLAVIG